MCNLTLSLNCLNGERWDTSTRPVNSLNSCLRSWMSFWFGTISLMGTSRTDLELQWGRWAPLTLSLFPTIIIQWLSFFWLDFVILCGVTLRSKLSIVIWKGRVSEVTYEKVVGWKEKKRNILWTENQCAMTSQSNHINISAVQYQKLGISMFCYRERLP